MKDEIKEILEYLKDEDEYYKKAEEVIVGYGDLIVEKEDIDKLLDYITNLQEENQRLKDYLKIMEKGKDNNLNRFLDYKSRCEKAIEELDKYINSCEIEAEHTLNNEKCLISINHSKKVKNILNGGDE